MPDQIPLFSDNDKTRAQESPSSNQGDSPRATGAVNAANTDEQDRRDFEEWRASRQDREVKSDQHGEYDKPEETAAYAPSAPSGRKVAPTEASTSEAKPEEVPEEEEPHSYVWLPNGVVLLVKDADLPSHAGLGAENGYWEMDGKVYQIAAIYPQETTKEKK